MARDALRSITSLCRGGRDAACAAALVLARASLASCTLTGGSGRMSSLLRETGETGEVAGDVAASRSEGALSASIFLFSNMRLAQAMVGQQSCRKLLDTDLAER